jgi:hypothetical protein
VFVAGEAALDVRGREVDVRGAEGFEFAALGDVQAFVEDEGRGAERVAQDEAFRGLGS